MRVSTVDRKHRVNEARTSTIDISSIPEGQAVVGCVSESFEWLFLARCVIGESKTC